MEAKASDLSSFKFQSFTNGTHDVYVLIGTLREKKEEKCFFDQHTGKTYQNLKQACQDLRGEFVQFNSDLISIIRQQDRKTDQACELAQVPEDLRDNSTQQRKQAAPIS